MSVSRTVSEIFSVKECRSLETGGTGRSRSLEMAPFDNHIRLFIGPPYNVYLVPFLSYLTLKNIVQKYPAFDASVRGSPSEYCHNVWYGKTRMIWPANGEKFDYVFSRFDIIPACDRQTDVRYGQTSYHCEVCVAR